MVWIRAFCVFVMILILIALCLLAFLPGVKKQTCWSNNNEHAILSSIRTNTSATGDVVISNNEPTPIELNKRILVPASGYYLCSYHIYLHFYPSASVVLEVYQNDHLQNKNSVIMASRIRQTLVEEQSSNVSHTFPCFLTKGTVLYLAASTSRSSRVLLPGIDLEDPETSFVTASLSIIKQFY